MQRNLESMPSLRPKVKIASSASSAPALERINASGTLEVELEHVVLDETGRAADGAGVEMLWRHIHLFPRAWSSAALTSLPDLRWFHTDHVGVDSIPLPELAARKIVLTNGVGLHSRPIAEWLVMTLLGAVKQYAHWVRSSDAGIWNRDVALDELRGKRALVIGFGGIGSEFATLVRPFGVEIVAAVRYPRAHVPPNVDRLVVGDAWRAELVRADFVILTLPGTGDNLGMIDSAAFAAMKPGAWLLNVSRGSLVDVPALLKALDNGSLGGAALDAFDHEPLPPDSPLWGRPNVLVTPHYTWNSSQTVARVYGLLSDNVRTYLAGKPLLNVVDYARGY